MACNLTAGRKEPCKDVVGGIRKVYFTDFGGYGTVTQTNDEITDMSGTFTAFEYELKGNSSFEQTITSSRENGTTFFEQTLNLTLKKLSKEDNKELKLLAYGRPHVAVEDYNGNVFVMGLEHGAEVSGGTIVTGAAMGDLSGYTLTLSAQEVLPANFVSSPTAADPFAGMSSATVTVTEGTNS
ncbi:MAG: hypothetical protein Tp156SUR1554471_43 [Prokaryotic dsDNA virus sp.]|nr:MAG: hypothetical protein Tp156SUR1554471_43 [Prokaryotic dsDNA virus sp.]|tara:strand:- start:126 stop:674 length:549 start_codon:yes stop_codon:yes gene_type:complete